MRHEFFLQSIRKAYLEARIPKYASNRNTVIRCTSHSISSVAEDLFAKYCSDLLKSDKNLRILIDPQISFSVSGLRNKSGKRPLLYRPDVCFLKNNVVTTVFDIKTDLGYKRKEIVTLAAALNETIERIQGARCTVNLQNVVEQISVAKKLKKYIVVISGAENSGNIQQTKKVLKTNHKIEMLILSLGDHLNTYKSKTNFEVSNDFELLDNIILSN